MGSATLRGLDARTRSDIWAVGSKSAQGATLAEHWNGTRWSVVATPNKSGFTQFEDVTIVSRDDVWAVGFYVPSGGRHPKTMIQHWNGTKWKVVPSPNPLSGNNVLFGVDAVSARNIWAVGGNNLGAGASSKQITLKWNGSSWLKKSAISVESGLEDVASIAATNVVSAGHYGTTGTETPLIQRFNGTGWSVEPVMPTSSPATQLQAISAKGSTAAWAVGDKSGNAALQTLTMRNTGSGWSEVPSANSSSTLINVLHGVATISADEAWAVGYRESSSFVRRTAVHHFVNGVWTIVPSPNPNAKAADLLDVVSVGGDQWAVGFSTTSQGTRVLVEAHRC